jgi:two-component system response regulator RegA
MKFPNNTLKISDFEDKTLLIVDDDDPFRGRLGRAMTSKGFEVTLAKGVEEAKLMAKKKPSSFCCYRPSTFGWQWTGCS